MALDFRLLNSPEARIVLIAVKRARKASSHAAPGLFPWTHNLNPETCLESISRFTSNVGHGTESNI